jgi:hypothetical protein
MTDVDTGSRDRLAVAVLTQYRMATTEQMHLILSPDVRIEQTRRRLMKLRGEELIDRVTLPQAGRMRVWYATRYGAQVASEWPELRGRRPPRGAHDRTAVRLGVGHGLTVTETALAFLQDARRHGDMCQPLDWIPEVHHPLGGGEAVIPDALLYYSRCRRAGAGTHRKQPPDRHGLRHALGARTRLCRGRSAADRRTGGRSGPIGAAGTRLARSAQHGCPHATHRPQRGPGRISPAC